MHFCERFCCLTAPDHGIAKRCASVEKYNVMIKRIGLSLFIVLLSSSMAAATTNTVSARYGRQGNVMRVVLESTGDFVKNTTVITSSLQIEIVFPSAFDITKPQDFPYALRKKDRILYLSLQGKDIFDVKVTRLSDPARLVLDLKTGAVPAKGSSPQPPQKAIRTTKEAQSAPQKAAGPQSSQPQRHKLPVVVIDPGHGGYDYGILSNEATEKDTDLALAKDIAGALAKKGMVVFMTRRADQYVAIRDRILFSNSKAPDLFISIHSSLANYFALYTSDVVDLSADDAANAYRLNLQQQVHLEQSRSLAKSLGKAIVGEFTGDVVVLRQLPLPLLNGMAAPAVLLEYPSVRSVHYDQKMRGMVVDAIVKGIETYEQ
jgi:N-acetylmuramoyl-L-alanine amidase